MKNILLLSCLLLPVFGLGAVTPPQMSGAPALTAKAYLLFDYTGNQVLVNQNGAARMAPASLTKLMTA